jgi:integrase
VSHIPLVLPFDNWPAADRTAWASAVQPSGLFGDGGALAQSAAGSLQIYRQGYAQWLSFLARNEPEVLAQAPVQRVTQARVQGFVDESLGRNVKPRTIATHLMTLIIVLRAFGSGGINWLNRAERRMYRGSEPNRLKKPLPISAEALFAWSVNRLSDLDKGPADNPVNHAVAFRQALMVGIQVACPVRRRAMVAMTVDKHVVPVGDGFLLRWAAADMKDRRRREMPLPGPLAVPLRRYLDHWRPILLRDTISPALWISERGAALSDESYQAGLAVLTKREFGVTLRPHAFRHIAATSIAEKNPAEAGIIRDVLGHATIRTSEMYYNRAEARAATGRLQDLLDKVRKSGSMKGVGKPPPLAPKPLSIESEEE